MSETMVAVHHLADYAGPYPARSCPCWRPPPTRRRAAGTAIRSGCRGWPATARGWPNVEGRAEIRWLDGDRGSIGSVRPTLAALAPALADGAQPAVLHTHFGT